MKNAAVLAVLIAAVVRGQAPVNVMPAPARMMRLPGEWTVDATFRASITGYRDESLERAVQRFATALSAKTGARLDGVAAPDGKSTTVRIRCAGPGRDAANESYTLVVRSAGVELKAQEPLGVLRGLATLYELVNVTTAGAAAPAVSIEDRPRFEWRGLMIDVARHFMPVDDLLRQIDGMEMVKLNVLHLHLSDAQAFRVESKVWPKLTADGSEGLFYTQDDIRRIVAYAQDRGVRVVPEFDVPGHTKAWLVGYPELAAKPGLYHMGADADVAHATLDPSKEQVYEFLDRLFGEMAALFPDRTFHIGGDEVTGRHWAASPSIQAFMKEKGFADQHQLQAYFTGRVYEIVRKHGKTMIGWDEILRPGLPTDVVVQAWRSSKMMARAAIDGHAVIESGPYYLDFVLPAGYHYRMDPVDTASFGISAAEMEMAKGTPIGPYMTVDKVVSGPTPLTPAQQGLIKGGEAALWSELVTAEMLDGRLWPRMAAIAERFWSPKTVVDEDDMYRRLAAIDRDLETIGLRHRTNSRLMLERFAAGYGATVGIFAETVEPIKFYGRHSRRSQPGRPPEGRALADATPPENLAIRQFEREVRSAAANRYGPQEVRDHVRAMLTVWRDNEDRFAEAAAENAALRPFLPMSRDLAALARAGLEAMTFQEQRKRAPARWLETQLALTGKYKDQASAAAGVVYSILRPQPATELTLAVAPSIEILIKAVK